jgi:hypothetical protein
VGELVDKGVDNLLGFVLGPVFISLDEVVPVHNTAHVLHGILHEVGAKDLVEFAKGIRRLEHLAEVLE